MGSSRQGPRQRETMNEMIAAMRRFEWDMHDTVARAGRLPQEWRDLWETRSAVKQRVTLRLDRDVLTFFKAMGAGYGPRMNAILRAFMQARLSGLIEHGDLAEKYREDWMGQERPTQAALRRRYDLALTRLDRMRALGARITAGETLTPEEVAELQMLSDE